MPCLRESATIAELMTGENLTHTHKHTAMCPVANAGWTGGGLPFTLGHG